MNEKSDQDAMTGPGPVPDSPQTVGTGNSPDLPTEQIVELTVSNGLSVPLICSPNNLGELAVGWLFGQNMIAGIDDILSLQICDEGIRILVQIRPNDSAAGETFSPVRTSGCSGGVMDVRRYRSAITPCASSMTVTMRELNSIVAKMYELWREQDTDGGTHCAALSPGGTMAPLILAGDIGRHNAVDKVIGMALRKKIDLGQMMLVTSGRISSEMILKAIHAGIPIVATPRSATTLAASLAQRAGIALVCRLSKRQPVILGRTDRIGE